MSLNDHENNPIETEFNKLNISDRDSNPVSNHKNCSYCDKPFTEELWCKECDPFRVMEGWTSGNPAIDKFIKDTMCKPAEYDIDKVTKKVIIIDFLNGHHLIDLQI